MGHLLHQFTLKKKKMENDTLGLPALLFAQHDYDGVSMRDIAMVVGVTPATLYSANWRSMFSKTLYVAIRKTVEGKDSLAMLAFSIIGTVMFPFQVASIRRFMPVCHLEQDDLGVLYPSSHRTAALDVRSGLFG